MKYLILAFSLMLSPLVAEVISIPPSGDFAKIDINDSNKIIGLLIDESTPLNQKREIAQKVAFHPGDYNPAVLVRTAVFFLSQQNLKESALLFVRGVFRAEIDIRISQDKTVEEATGILFDWIEEALELYIESKEDLTDWKKIEAEAWANFEEWDRATPRNYDQNWIRLHSLDALFTSSFKEISSAEKQKIIERFYRESKAELTDEDYATPSREDEYYFDRKNRIFYYQDANLSFYVPKCISTEFDRWGKYTSSFELPNEADLWLNYSWPSSGETYDTIIDRTTRFYKFDEEGAIHTIEKIQVGDGIPALKEYETFGDNQEYLTITFHIIKGNYHFELEIECDREDEQFLLKEIEPLLASIKFDSENT